MKELIRRLFMWSHRVEVRATIRAMQSRIVELEDQLASAEEHGAKLDFERDELYRAENILRRYPEGFAEYKNTPHARNQCDGCQRGIPVNENGHHPDEQSFPMACTKDRYEAP